MLGPIFVFSLVAAIGFAALRKPAWGIIGFYGFYLLDAPWNWRWSLPEGLEYQKLLVALIFIGFVLSGCRIAKQAKASKRGIAAALLFYAVCTLSTAQSIAPESSNIFMEDFWKQLFVALLGILIFDNYKDLKTLLVVAALAQGYNAYQINLDYFETGIARFARLSTWGSAGLDNNTYSLLTVPIAGISMCLGLHSSKLWFRLLFFGVTLLQIHQIMLMGSRGCMLGSLPMFAYILWKSPRTRQNIRDLAITITCVFLLAGPTVVNEFASSFESKENRDSSAESRLYLWDAGLRITLDYPMIGTGPNASRHLVPSYYEGGLSTTNKALHNLFFDISCGTGLVGFFFYITFWFTPIIYLLRANIANTTIPMPLHSAVIAGLIGYFVASIFSSGVLIESSYILVVTGYALINVNTLENETRKTLLEA